MRRHIYRAAKATDTCRCECGAEVPIYKVGEHDCPRLRPRRQTKAVKALEKRLREAEAVQ